ncbi:MAG: hypothetical protein Nk1A_6930 [Endomicrobiia bacterium]|nr:MAG: hypothetical protein Nk1A_6930 [Endomicrobiia bacterium]
MQVSKNIDSWFNDIKNKSIDAVVSTGFTNLDIALGGGLRTKRLYAIGGVTGIGKTTFVMNIADNIASSGQDVLIFSLEMSITKHRKLERNK